MCAHHGHRRGLHLENGNAERIVLEMVLTTSRLRSSALVRHEILTSTLCGGLPIAHEHRIVQLNTAPTLARARAHQLSRNISGTVRLSARTSAALPNHRIRETPHESTVPNIPLRFNVYARQKFVYPRSETKKRRKEEETRFAHVKQYIRTTTTAVVKAHRTKGRRGEQFTSARETNRHCPLSSSRRSIKIRREQRRQEKEREKTVEETLAPVNVQPAIPNSA